MLQSAEDAPRILEQGRSLFGPGWKYVNSFDDLADDEDEYEDEEDDEEIYVTLDLGETIDSKALQTETQYQLIGLDTPLPFLKLGNHVFQGEVTPLIGDEVILGLERNHENPHAASHPPLYTTSHRLTFRGVTLQSRTEAPIATANEQAPTVPDIPNHPSTPLNPTSQAGPSTLPGDPFESPSAPPAKVRGRPKGSGRSRRVLHDPSELETFDMDGMKPHQSVELGPRVIESLGIASPGETILPLTLSKKELERVISDWPVSGSGSRGGRGRKPRGLREVTTVKQSEVEEGAMDVDDTAGDAALPAGSEPSTVGIQTMGEGAVTDIEMREKEDEDPPWQVVINDGVAPS
ncbi:hypothetical protein CI109_103101 [Kwoniella shandongensis]|uniref:Uncharacterized protein n=1 Tax=Kwoniella shandongensis TaxID=1734106 RepID=A0A5M6C955_9TREE|nr:uncharacterized protein CI109_000292 [Kwoniella shandongensis]KAA5531451.1 hypothetical protein CI109_000292 [Kwoniella shandongensis]